MNKLTKQIIISSFMSITLLMSGCSESDGYSSSKIDSKLNDKVVVEPPIVLKPVDPYRTAGWYGRTTISAEATDGTVYEHMTAGIFGELIQSIDGKDQHDIPAYQASILQVMMIDDALNQNNTFYFSNYKHFDANNVVKRTWTFQVKNQITVDLSNAPIKITLPTLYNVSYRDDRGRIEYKEATENNTSIMSNLHLVDVDNQTEYTIDTLATANLNMDGKHTRTFRWVLGSTDANDYQPLFAVQRSAGRNAVVTAEEFTPASVQQSGGGKFGLPPM